MAGPGSKQVEQLMQLFTYPTPSPLPRRKHPVWWVSFKGTHWEPPRSGRAAEDWIVDDIKGLSLIFLGVTVAILFFL